MDTLDKVFPSKKSDTDTNNRDRIDLRDANEIADKVETLVEDTKDAVEDAVEKVNWWRVAKYAAAGLAVVAAAGGYAYWKSQQKKPLTRLERLRAQLGLAHVDFADLKSTINKFDLEELKHSGRNLGTKAKKATHVVSQKVADLTH